MGKHHGGGGFKSGGGSSFKSSGPSFKSSSKPHKSPSHSNTSHKPVSSAAKHHYTPSYKSHAASASHGAPHSSHRHASHRPHVSHFEGEGPGLLEGLWDFLFGARTPELEAEPQPGWDSLRRPEPTPPLAAATSADPRELALRGMHRAPMTTIDWRLYRDAPDPGGEGTQRWAELRDLATRVVAADTLAYQEALTLCGCLVEVHGHVGRDGIYVTLRPDGGHVDIRAPLGNQIGEVVKTTSERLDLYQDYVCGLSLRVARELLAALPIEEVTVDLWNVTAPPAALDASGAYREAAPTPTQMRIASMRCSRNALGVVPWEFADASQVVESLPHEMRFVAGQGFYEVPHVGSR